MGHKCHRCKRNKRHCRCKDAICIEKTSSSAISSCSSSSSSSCSSSSSEHGHWRCSKNGLTFSDGGRHSMFRHPIRTGHNGGPQLVWRKKHGKVKHVNPVQN
jgi:hypothetical protein